MTATWTAANGYGLYDPALPITRFPIADLPDIASAEAARVIFPVTRDELLAYHQALIGLDRQVNTLPPESVGDPAAVTPVMRPGQISHVYQEWYGKVAPTPDCVMLYNRLRDFSSYGPPDYWPAEKRLWPESGGQFEQLWLEDVPWVRAFQETFQDVYDLQAAQREAQNQLAARYTLVIGDGDLAHHSGNVESAISPEIRYRIVRRLTLAFMQIDPAGVTPGKVSSNPDYQNPAGVRLYVRYWLDKLQEMAKWVGDPARRDHCRLLYEWSYNPVFHGPAAPRFDAETLVVLWRMLPENDFIRVFLRCPGAMEDFTDPDRRITDRLYADAPELRELVRRVAERAIDVEIEGVDGSGTPLSQLARCVRRFGGAERFAAIVAAMGGKPVPAPRRVGPDGRTPRRPKEDGESRRGGLICLLRACHPAEGDDAGLLRRCLAARAVPAEQLAEAVGYAPQWKTLVAKSENTL